MTQYNSVSVKLSNQQLNKFKLVTKNATEATLKLSSIISCNSNDETSFSLELLLIGDFQIFARRFLQIIYQLIWNYQIH